MSFSVTNTFAPATIIQSSKVNQNFTDVVNSGNTHESATTGIHGVGGGDIVGTTLTQNLTNKTITSPTINDAHFLSSGASFDLILSVPTVFTADRTMTWDMGNVSRTVTMPGVGTTTTFDPSDIRQYYYGRDDFLSPPTSHGTSAGPLGLFMNISGGSASGTGDSTHPGILQLSTSTSSTAQTSINSNSYSTVFGSGAWSIEWLVRMPTLSDGTNRYTTRVGFLAPATGDPSDGVYFRYIDNVNSGKWVLVTRSGGSESTSNSSSTPSANTWYRLGITLNAAGTLATYYVDGSSIGTLSTNIPTSSGTGFGAGILKSVGTAPRTLDLDYVQLSYTPTAARS